MKKPKKMREIGAKNEELKTKKGAKAKKGTKGMKTAKATKGTNGLKKAPGRAVAGFGAAEGGVGRDEDSKAMVGLIQALMGWYLDKLNGDPQFEGFDILMMVEGPEGRMGQKFVMGGYEESLARLRQDLETEHAGCDRYVYAWRGWWQKPDGEKFDGALLCLESRHITPGIYGIPIASTSSGPDSPDSPWFRIGGDLQRLAVGEWSLLHRSPK